LHTTSTWRPTYCAAPSPCADPKSLTGDIVAISKDQSCIRGRS
jgi:hypothetical protein